MTTCKDKEEHTKYVNEVMAKAREWDNIVEEVEAEDKIANANNPNWNKRRSK